MLKAVATLDPADLVRGQFRGYRKEPGVAPDSNVETFAAVKLAINSWRWQGVPFYIRAGKCLPVTCTEVLLRLKRPPTVYPDVLGAANHFRFRVSPDVTLALGATVMDAADRSVGAQVELLGEPPAGRRRTRRLHRRQCWATRWRATRRCSRARTYVEEAWRIVDPVLAAGVRVHPYEPGQWGPAEAARLAPPGGWSDPVVRA